MEKSMTSEEWRNIRHGEVRSMTMTISEYVEGVQQSHAELGLPPLDEHIISLLSDAWHKATRAENARLREALRTVFKARALSFNAMGEATCNWCGAWDKDGQGYEYMKHDQIGCPFAVLSESTAQPSLEPEAAHVG